MAGRFYGNHPGTRQARGRRKVTPSTREERLESMSRELNNRIQIYGRDHWMTRMQRETIAEEKING